MVQFPSLKTLILIILFFGNIGCNSSKKEERDFKHTNSLIEETSPYLLQHAHNPVDWRVWSKSALELAEKENKLVLVSIGYSSCHWCHVMEKETFEDVEIAKIMNENFINIKVDREERPDVDQVYMTALQLIKGSGGWPLNVITLPNGKPIYGGTFHTKEQWAQVLVEVSNLYKKDPIKANEYADMVAEGIQDANRIVLLENFEALTQQVLEENVALWKPFWDMKWGGDHGEQKFMMPSNLDFLLDYGVISGDDSIKAHVKNSLDKIALGGVFDHMGGGFFRYSTDGYWKLPHFEKMLYDNAQLISLYSKAYKVFKEPLYKAVVLETISFLEREMKNPEGGYYAAIDADSEGEEGKYYVWSQDELTSILGSEFNLFASYFNIGTQSVLDNGNHLLLRTIMDDAFLYQNSLSKNNLELAKNKWKEKILAAREKRVTPNIDDKIITSWNSLLINGFVDAYNALGEEAFLRKAEATFNFIKEKNFANGQLIHSYKKGGRHITGFLEDYVFLVNASIKLYGTTLDTGYLDFAHSLNKKAVDKFKDESSGMFKYNQDKDLISTLIRTDDGVLPSPNAVMADNLFQLGHIFYDTDLLKISNTMVSSMLPMMSTNPQSYGKWSTLLLQMTHRYYEISVVGENAQKLVQELYKNHLPNTLIVGSIEASDLPLFEERFVEGGTYIYVCQNNSCKLPVTSSSQAIQQIKN
ncbi:thioredoxin domain-containing protein [soil metagenome]